MREDKAKLFREPTGVWLDDLSLKVTVSQKEIDEHWGYIYLIEDSVLGELYIGVEQNSPKRGYFKSLGAGEHMQTARTERPHTLQKSILAFTSSQLHAFFKRDEAINEARDLGLTLCNSAHPRKPKDMVSEILSLNCLTCGDFSPIEDYCDSCKGVRSDEVFLKKRSFQAEERYRPQIARAKEMAHWRALRSPQHAAMEAIATRYTPLREIVYRSSGEKDFLNRVSAIGGGVEIWEAYLKEAEELFTLLPHKK